MAFNSLNQCLGYAYVHVDDAEGAIKASNLKFEINGHILQTSKSTGKRDTLFQNMPYCKREQLKLDSVALFSVTDMNTANEINHLLAVMCQVGGAKLGADEKFSLGITDACACVGEIQLRSQNFFIM